MNERKRNPFEDPHKKDHDKLKKEYHAVSEWLTKYTDPKHPNRPHMLQLRKEMELQLRKIKLIRQGQKKGQDELFMEIVRESMSSEASIRIEREAKSRIEGNAPMIISLVTEKEQQIINEYYEKKGT